MSHNVPSTLQRRRTSAQEPARDPSPDTDAEEVLLPPLVDITESSSCISITESSTDDDDESSFISLSSDTNSFRSLPSACNWSCSSGNSCSTATNYRHHRPTSGCAHCQELRTIVAEQRQQLQRKDNENRKFREQLGTLQAKLNSLKILMQMLQEDQAEDDGYSLDLSAHSEGNSFLSLPKELFENASECSYTSLGDFHSVSEGLEETADSDDNTITSDYSVTEYVAEVPLHGFHSKATVPLSIVDDAKAGVHQSDVISPEPVYTCVRNQDGFHEVRPVSYPKLRRDSLGHVSTISPTYKVSNVRLRNSAGTTFVYTGDFDGQKPHGMGKAQYSNHGEIVVRYTGQWEHGDWQGRGRLIRGNTVYHGEFQNSCKHGRGKYLDENGKQWEGEFESDSLIHGNVVAPTLRKWALRTERKRLPEVPEE